MEAAPYRDQLWQAAIVALGQIERKASVTDPSCALIATRLLARVHVTQGGRWDGTEPEKPVIGEWTRVPEAEVITDVA